MSSRVSVLCTPPIIGRHLFCLQLAYAVDPRATWPILPSLPTRLFIIVSRRVVVIVRNRVEPRTGSAYGIAQCLLGGMEGPLIQELITLHRLDALGICESWICGDDPDAIKLDSVPDGFCVMHFHSRQLHIEIEAGIVLHTSRRTDGEAASDPAFDAAPIVRMSAAVDIEAQDRPADKPLVIANIYRPPSATIPSKFCDELSDLFTRVGDFIDADRFIMCGDFNCPGPNSTVDAELLSLLDYHGLPQHVSTPTHHTSTTNNVLDLLVGSSDSDRIASVEVRPSHDVSDHNLVTWSIARQPLPPRHTITYSFRNIKSIDLPRFQDDIKNSSLFTDPVETADEFAVQIDKVVTDILDVHCPLQTRTKLSSSSSHRDSRWLLADAISA